MKKSILLIEDDKIVRENTTEILELANFKVSTAENGKAGVSLAKKIIPDIIICDILMPKLDGFGVLQIVSKTPSLVHVPFIFLTAKTHHDDLRKGMELGADDYITKPFEESELLRAIDTRLKRVEAFENKQIKQSNKTISNHSSNNLKEFLSTKTIYKYKKDENIYCKGNLSNHVFLIKKGEIKTYKINDHGKEFITGLFSSSDFFGYSSFIKQKPHFENSKAITNVQLYKINKNEIDQLTKLNPSLLFNIIDVLASDLINVKEKLLLIAYGSVRYKTAATLLNLSKKLPLKMNGEIKITRSNLANTIGIAKETLIRTLHDFKIEKVISESKNGIKIIDKNKLMKVQ